MYERLGQDETETFFQKFYRYIYPIISISLLNYTMSNTYSLMVNHQEATGTYASYKVSYPSSSPPWSASSSHSHISQSTGSPSSLLCTSRC